MIDKGRFLFKANRYKDYYVSFEYMGKHMLGILGYASELEVCIVHKGMHVAKTTEAIKGFIKSAANKKNMNSMERQPLLKIKLTKADIIHSSGCILTLQLI
ncbi:MAG: hypothetical protein IPO06_12575 [Leptospiraceae bacterium]|nr:hypothetical protein [Leptospiraceae bacterium]